MMVQMMDVRWREQLQRTRRCAPAGCAQTIMLAAKAMGTTAADAGSTSKRWGSSSGCRPINRRHGGRGRQGARAGPPRGGQLPLDEVMFVDGF